MTSEEIRKLKPAEGFLTYGPSATAQMANQFEILREIAAQLAELNVSLKVANRGNNLMIMHLTHKVHNHQ